MVDHSDIEKKLKEASDNINPGDFNERYKAIKNRLEPRTKNKRFSWKKRIGFVAPGLAAALAIILPITLIQPRQQEPVRYFIYQLDVQPTTEEDFYTELNNVNISVVGLSDYVVQNYLLYMTQDLVVKGGAIEVFDDEIETSMYASLELYDKSVIINEDHYATFDLSYQIGDTNILYEIVEHVEAEDMESYSYTAIAWYKDTTYLINYDTLQNDIIDFFNNLFVD